MRILVLGGTRGIGAAIAQELSDLGHDVTGSGRKPAAQSFQTVVMGYGEPDIGRFREAELVVDVVGGPPWFTERNVELARNEGARYILLSSTAAYRSLEPVGIDEEAETKAPLYEEAPFSAEVFGRWKVACERLVLRQQSPNLVLRAGVLGAPDDGRMARLCHLVNRGEPFDLPDSPSHSIQILDARDIAVFVELATNGRMAGIFNLVPSHSQTWHDLVTSLGGDLDLVRWLSYQQIAAGGGAVLDDPPFWMPRFGVGTGFYEVNSDKAVKAGWQSRSLEVSARWYLGSSRNQRAEYSGRIARKI